MNWIDKVKQKPPERIRSCMQVDFADSPELNKWLEEQAKRYSVAKARIIKAILSDAMEASMDKSFLPKGKI